MNNKIDFLSYDIFIKYPKLLEILLMDRTTNENIIFATSDYTNILPNSSIDSQITITHIIGENSGIIQPRVLKSKQEQLKRTKDKAEVFTPLWVVNKQNNLIDEIWFERKEVFNKEYDNRTYTVIKDKIEFPNNKTWKDYINSNRLEICCGEAPYLVNRYDTVTGEFINIIDRVGLLDRKLRIINENIEDIETWLYWVKQAYKSIYGYEYQGDSLLIARENLFFTFIDTMLFKFNIYPSLIDMQEIAEIISWNIWQMDGIQMTVPYIFHEYIYEQISLFEEGNIIIKDHSPIFCRIFDWELNKSIEFKSMLK